MDEKPKGIPAWSWVIVSIITALLASPLLVKIYDNYFNLENTQGSSVNNQESSNIYNCKDYRVTRENGLYLYTAENGGTPILTTLPFNSKVSITKENSEGWAKVEYLRADGRTGEGWVYKVFISCIS